MLNTMFKLKNPEIRTSTNKAVLIRFQIHYRKGEEEGECYAEGWVPRTQMEQTDGYILISDCIKEKKELEIAAKMDLDVVGIQVYDSEI